MKLLIYFITFLFLASCSKVVDYEIPYQGDKIVLNGLLTPDSVVQVSVFRSIPVGKEIGIEKIIISNAYVELWEDSIKIENLLHTQKGIYRSPSQFRPKIGKGYKIKVTAEGLSSVETEMEYIPEMPILTSANFQDSIFISTNRAVVAKMTFIITQTLKDDYYWVDFRGYKDGIVKYPNQTWVVKNINSCGADNYGMYASFIFSDECQSFPSFPIEIKTETSDYDGRFDSIKVSIASINKQFYDYQNVIAHQPIGGFDGTFSEGKTLPSNVKGGNGILVGYSQVGVVFGF